MLTLHEKSYYHNLKTTYASTEYFLLKKLWLLLNVIVRRALRFLAGKSNMAIPALQEKKQYKYIMKALF